MFAPFLLVNLLLSIHPSSTATLNRVSNSNYTWANPHASPRINLPDSAPDQSSVKVSNISSSNRHRVACDPGQFGTHGDPDSCRDALGEVFTYSGSIKVGQRGFGDFTIQLPFRWISGHSMMRFLAGLRMLI